MKFVILTENRKGIEACTNENGLSIYIESDNGKLLLDTGITDSFIKNANNLNIDLNKVNIIVLSHGHYDHSGGLNSYKKRIKLVCHPDCCMNRISKRTNTYGGINYTKADLEKNFDLLMTKEPYEILENIYFLGEIPRKLSFECNNFPMVVDDGSDDTAPDDTGLVIQSDKGLIVISGCAHSGICNTIEYAKEIMNEDKVYAVIGGFHLKDIDESTDKTIKYFIDNNIKNAFMGHCTSDEVIETFKIQLEGKCDVQKLFSGYTFEL